MLEVEAALQCSRTVTAASFDDGKQAGFGGAAAWVHVSGNCLG